MKLQDLIPYIHSNFEIYYKGQHCGDFDFEKNDIDNDSFKWLLDLSVVDIETDEEPIIAIYTRD